MKIQTYLTFKGQTGVTQTPNNIFNIIDLGTQHPEKMAKRVVRSVPIHNTRKTKIVSMIGEQNGLDDILISYFDIIMVVIQNRYPPTYVKSVVFNITIIKIC